MAGQKTDDRDVHLGRRMAEQRKRAGLTQRTVAQSFGVSAAQLQKYEKGTNRISAIHLAILSRLTGTPLADFFAGMPRLDEVPYRGLSEAPQEGLATAGSWAGLALVVAQHVTGHFNDGTRRELAAAVDVLSRELKD